MIRVVQDLSSDHEEQINGSFGSFLRSLDESSLDESKIEGARRFPLVILIQIHAKKLGSSKVQKISPKIKAT